MDKIIHLFCCLAFIVIKSRLLLHIFTKTTNEIAIPDSSRKIIRQPDQPRELPHPSTKSRAPERGIRRDVRCGEGASSLPVDHCAGSEHLGRQRGRSTGNTTVALAQNQGRYRRLHGTLQCNVSVRTYSFSVTVVYLCEKGIVFKIECFTERQR